MRSDRAVLRFEHIVENIERIERYLGGRTFEGLKDALARDAVERCLERICEAARVLGGKAEELAPDVNWKVIRATGNYLRHEYDRLDHDLLSLAIDRDLPALRQASSAAIAKLTAK